MFRRFVRTLVAIAVAPIRFGAALVRALTLPLRVRARLRRPGRRLLRRGVRWA